MASEKVKESISDRKESIFKTLNEVSSKKCQYIENVAAFCEKEYDWDWSIIMEAISTAKLERL